MRPPLLLWHGVMRSARTFAPILPSLAAWNPQAFDHRGHGDAPRADSYLVADYAADARKLIREPVILYGHSLGALVAACIADSPHVRGVILEDPPSPAFLADVDATAYGKLFRDFQRIARQPKSVAELAADLKALNLPRDAASLRLSARMLRELDPAVLDPLLEGRWLDGIDFHAILGRIKCPVLLLQADESAGGMLSDAECAKMLDCLVDATPARFPGVGHQLHWLATESLFRHVLAFLESL